MAEKRDVTKEDIYIKARILSEGMRVQGLEMPPFEVTATGGTMKLPEKMDMSDCEEFLKYYSDWILNQAKSNHGRLGGSFKFDGSDLQVPIYPNKHSRLDCVIEGRDVTIKDGDEVLVTGKMPTRPAWHDAKLSNGMPIIVALPVMSAGIINIVFSLSCNNYNTGRGCRYCNLFANPVSRKIVMLPKETLRQWARYQGEAVKIATDNGWRGTLAISGGALPPKHRGEYMERLGILMDEIRDAIGDEMLSKLRTTFNHYPPEDFNDMHEWKEYGVKGTSFDLEVMDSAYFAAICPGKHAYKPHEYWKKAQEASVEIFGPYMKTAGCVVVGIEPMSTLLKGTDERLSKGVMPLPLIFGSAPGSAYWGFRPPTADWLVESAERMADIYLKYAGEFIKAAVRPGAGGSKGGPRTATQSTPLSLVFDEIQRRVRGLMGGAGQDAGDDSERPSGPGAVC